MTTKHTPEQSRNAWIGVDLDGTLARHHTNWTYPDIGEPVPEMVRKVRQALDRGYDVRILTARMAMCGTLKEYADTEAQIQAWFKEHVRDVPVTVTAFKDGAMVELWDDRAVGVERNTGKFLSESPLGIR